MTCRTASKERNRLMVSMSKIFSIVLLLGGTGCVAMHHAQVGEIDSKTVLEGERFEIKLSAVGVDTEEVLDGAADVAGLAGKSEEAQSIADIIKLFQMGPRTGYPTFKDHYSDEVIDKLRAACPSGSVSGLVSIRETADYGMVSGEIVKLVGYCSREP